MNFGFQKLNQVGAKTLLLAAFALPMDSSQNWQILEFRNIKPHKTEFTTKGLKLKVEASASPIIFPLPQGMKVSEVQVEGLLSGLLTLKKEIAQGQKGNDDYTLRIGLVVEGKKRLNFAQRMVAASWVKKLFDLAPKDKGVDRIEFLVATQTAEAVGQKRVHPLTDLIQEQVVWSLLKPGAFNLSHKFSEPLPVVAIWLSIDGDDTKSSYEINLSKIQLVPAE